MDEKKRIEELADFLWHNTLIHTEDLCHDVAETVIIEGYRKQSENVVELPCKVGSTIYRIDYREHRCSPENESYCEYYCRDCEHLELGYCDYRREVPYIFVIKDADAQTILGNEHLFGTRAFLSQEEAEQALAKMKGGE